MQIKTSGKSINTPIGRYRFLRLPFSIFSASEVFQRSIAQMIEGLEGVVRIIDDLLVRGNTIEEHDQRLIQLKRARNRQSEIKQKQMQNQNEGNQIHWTYPQFAGTKAK